MTLTDMRFTDMRRTALNWAKQENTLGITQGYRSQEKKVKNEGQITAIVQSLSHIQLFATPWTAVPQASLAINISWSLLKLMSIELVMLFNHLILCHPLLLPSIFPRKEESDSRKSH